MKRLVMIGVPILYVTGTIWFASIYLSNGGEDLIKAIAFGARWPFYINTFLG